MTSLQRNPAQISRATGYYVPLATLSSVIYAEPAQAANGTTGNFVRAGWTTTERVASTIISGALGYPGMLKDMGKTLVSAQRTFRKVQLVTSTTSTFGVAGALGTAPDSGYLTGYIELGYEGYGVPAPVASVGR
jgi:hypothetical protein